MATAVDDIRFCAVDTETTGLDVRRDEIVAFASIPIVCARIKMRELCYTLVKPRCYRHQAMKYHGLGQENLSNARSFQELARMLLGTLDGVLVGYAIEFDYRMLQRHFSAAGLPFRREVVDIALIERWLRRRRHVAEDDFSFEALMAAYGLKPHYRHNACADAFFAAQIFQWQLRQLQACGVHTADQVIRLSKPCRWPEPGLAF
jgi:DNA polymerase-3 subunit epsilon